MSSLEKYSPHIVESRLRNRDGFEIIDTFVQTASPSFRDFDNVKSLLLENGCGLDCQLILLHQEFIDIHEHLIMDYLSDIDVSFESFSRAAENNVDLSTKALRSWLNSLASFITFGEMMFVKFKSIYASENVDIQSNRPTTTLLPKSLHQLQVRVLWDIENINVSKRQGGLAVVSKLCNFLELKKLYGSGVDCRISAFFNPDKPNLARTVVNELDKAGVELVWVSQKREDADRKLGMRINQEMQTLLPESTVFVVISSDQDFRHHYQLLRSAGYRVLVLHDAQTESWRQSVEMHASEAYHWSEVLDLEPSRHAVNVTMNGLISNRVTSNCDDVVCTAPPGCSTGASSVSSPLAGGGPLYMNCSAPSHSHQSRSHRRKGRRGKGDMDEDSSDELAPAVGVTSKTISLRALMNSPRSGAPPKDGAEPSRETDSGSAVCVALLPRVVTEAEWQAAICVRWKGAYGFIDLLTRSVSTSSQGAAAVAAAELSDPATAGEDSAGAPSEGALTSTGCRVYVHYKCLNLDPPRAYLKKGERVRVVTEATERGLRAQSVVSCLSSDTAAVIKSRVP